MCKGKSKRKEAEWLRRNEKGQKISQKTGSEWSPRGKKMVGMGEKKFSRSLRDVGDRNQHTNAAQGDLYLGI